MNLDSDQWPQHNRKKLLELLRGWLDSILDVSGVSVRQYFPVAQTAFHTAAAAAAAVGQFCTLEDTDNTYLPPTIVCLLVSTIHRKLVNQWFGWNGNTNNINQSLLVVNPHLPFCSPMCGWMSWVLGEGEDMNFRKITDENVQKNVSESLEPQIIFLDHQPSGNGF